MITTTLNRIREHKPCTGGWEKLLKHLNKTQPDNELLPYSVIVESNGIDDAVWCCRAEPQYAKEWRLFAVWCARRVQHLIWNDRDIKALDIAERYAEGKATDIELDSARGASYASKCAARAAWYTARHAAKAVEDNIRAAQKKKFLEIVGKGRKG